MDNIQDFGTKINALIQGVEITREEARAMFRHVLWNEQPDLQQGAFLAALTAKGETPEEIAGIWDAIYELDTVPVTPAVPQPIVENCGTGMDAHSRPLTSVPLLLSLLRLMVYICPSMEQEPSPPIVVLLTSWSL